MALLTVISEIQATETLCSHGSGEADYARIVNGGCLPPSSRGRSRQSELLVCLIVFLSSIVVSPYPQYRSAHTHRSTPPILLPTSTSSRTALRDIHTRTVRCSPHCYRRLVCGSHRHAPAQTGLNERARARPNHFQTPHTILSYHFFNPAQLRGMGSRLLPVSLHG